MKSRVGSIMDLRLVFLLCFLGLTVLFSRPATAEEPDRRILILNSYHAGYSWTDEMVTGIRETLRRGGFKGEPMVEYMDWKRLPFEESLAHQYRLYEYKYARQRLSVVFVTDNAAMDFALRYRDSLFSGAKVVFCGINGYTDRMIAGKNFVTGVVEDVDLPGTVEVALRLHPDAKEVLVIFDGTESAQAARHAAARKISHLGNRVRIRYMDAPEVSEIEAEVRRLPPTTIVVQGTYSRDGSGRIYNIDDVVRRIAPDSPAPVYGLWEAMVGKGILGGSLLSGRIQGETAGKLGLRILNGEDVSSIPVLLKTPMVLMFDYRQLKRFGVNTDLLPPNSVIINKPFSFYATYRHLIWSVVAVISLLTAIIGALLANIRARRRAEAALQREKHYIEQIISVAPTMICTVAEDGTTLSVNRAVTDVTGYSAEELVGEGWWRLFPSIGNDSQVEELLGDLRKGALLNHEMVLAARSGAKRIVSLNLVARGTEDNRALEIIGIGVDVTERKRAEMEREHFLRELEQKNKELESIVYVASHDLRTPLVNIQGFSRKLSKACDELNTLLPREELSKEVSRRADVIFRDTIPKSIHFISTSVDKMDTLLGGLLRLSRLGREALTIVELDMNELVENIVSSMAYQIQRTGGIVEVEPLSSCFGDPVQVNQVFSNIIDNAVKYCAPGRPLRVRVSSVADGDAVVYRVEDNGIGIPATQQGKIWEIFHRLNPESDVEGEGLGLTMVRRILDRCNGKVWVESEAGRGSVFFVSIPASQPHELCPTALGA